MAVNTTRRSAAPAAAPALWLAVPDGERSDRDAGADRASRDALLAYLEARGLRAGPGPGLSHAGGWSAYAVQRQLPGGVDLEWVRPRESLELARFAFAPEEARALEGLAPAECDAAFVALWVLKEAAAKALALDLFTALARCTFTIDGARLKGRLPTPLSWSASLYAPRPALRLACLQLLDPSRADDAARTAAAGGFEWHVGERDAHAAAWPLLAHGGG